jgi:hypothetical protein
MEILRRRLRAAAWLALAAMGALALLPALSHARAFGAGSGIHWVEVCTPQGVRWVAATAETGTGTSTSTSTPAASPTAPVSAAGHLEHCPWCQQPAHADHALPPARGHLPAPAPEAGGASRAACAGPLPGEPPWQPAQPRAPPQHG